VIFFQNPISEFKYQNILNFFRRNRSSPEQCPKCSSRSLVLVLRGNITPTHRSPRFSFRIFLRCLEEPNRRLQGPFRLIRISCNNFGHTYVFLRCVVSVHLPLWPEWSHLWIDFILIEIITLKSHLVAGHEAQLK